MQLYDRWGNLIFESYDFKPGEEDKGWNSQIARRGGSDTLNEGVYVYKLEVLLINGKKESFAGTVTLVF